MSTPEWVDIGLRFAEDHESTEEFRRRNNEWLAAWIAADRPEEKDLSAELRSEAEWLDRERGRTDSFLFVNHPMYRPGVLLELLEPCGEITQYVLGGFVRNSDQPTQSICPDSDSIDPQTIVLKARVLI